MSNHITKAVELRESLDYGIKIISKEIKSSRNISIALSRLEEAKTCLGLYATSLMGKDPYPNLLDHESLIIEESLHEYKGELTVGDLNLKLSGEETLDYIKILKYITGVSDQMTNLAYEIKMLRQPDNMSVGQSYTSNLFINNAFCALAIGTSMLKKEIREIGVKNRDLFPAKKVETDAPKAEFSAPEEAIATDELMKERVSDSGSGNLKNGEELTEENQKVLDGQGQHIPQGSGDEHSAEEMFQHGGSTESPIVLTDDDAQADLNGQPRPDNASSEATTEQVLEQNNESITENVKTEE